MTFFETYTLSNQYAELAFTAMAIYLTVLSGYLIAAYLAGSKLTKMQLSIISILFTVFTGKLTFVVFSYVGVASRTLTTIENYSASGFADYTGYVLAIIMVLGIFAAIKFMLDTRKNT